MKIKVVDGNNDVTSVFIKMLLKGKLDKDEHFIKLLRDNNNVAEVILTVNGYEMPFAETITDILAKNDVVVEELAAQRVLEIISSCGFSEINKIQEYMKEVQWKIKEQIEKVTGIKLPDEN